MAQASIYLLIIFFFLFMAQSSQSGKGIITKVFLSPKIEVEPGQVSNKIYLNMESPKGHIAIKSFDAELVDDKGNSVPLYDAYLHHWAVIRYFHEIKNQSNFIPIRDSGVCNSDTGFTAYFGSGAETRMTSGDVPDPYGIEVRNPADAPKGYQEELLLNVHLIDTRGAVDKRGCLECTCDLYSNITMNKPLLNYAGGLRCCTDGARCKVKEGFKDGKRSLFLKYTIKYLDWDASIVPVRLYNFDVTDLWTPANESGGTKAKHDCKIEYQVKACRGSQDSDNSCVDSKAVKFVFEDGGDVIYAVGHQHIGGIAISLYGEGGREICTSLPKYGMGKQPGNEAGYVVGMSSCYPQPGSVKISPGEMLTLVSNYSSTVRHTGVMGLFSILVADSSP